MTEEQKFILRLGIYIPPCGWIAKWFLPSECREAYWQIWRKASIARWNEWAQGIRRP